MSAAGKKIENWLIKYAKTKKSSPPQIPYSLVPYILPAFNGLQKRVFTLKYARKYCTRPSRKNYHRLTCSRRSTLFMCVLETSIFKLNSYNTPIVGTKSYNSWGLDSSFNITSLDPQIWSINSSFIILIII